MGFSCGIVGLPNVGKSTLFNALAAAHAEAQNFPFCTIEPNVGVVRVPDERLEAVAKVFRPEKVTPTSIEFVDIAGLVRGASRGEGLGNQFLAHIRELDAIAQVVRCFEDENVAHVEGRVDPVSDVETVRTELLLRDLETANKRLERARTQAKSGEPAERAIVAFCERLVAHLDAGKPARSFPMNQENERELFGELFLLTAKPVFYVANVDEGSIGRFAENAHYLALERLAKTEGAPIVAISAALEAQIAELDPADRPEFLASAGLSEPGLNAVIRAGYEMLGLITFFTGNAKECRAWTVKRGASAPQAAGKIHSDFERGFIKAEVIHWRDLVELGSEARCRETAKLRIEGREYVVADGDVIFFRFNV